MLDLNALHMTAMVNSLLINRIVYCYQCTLGKLVYFMGASKGTDEHRRIYDPQSINEDYLQLVAKDELDKIGRYYKEFQLLYVTFGI